MSFTGNGFRALGGALDHFDQIRPFEHDFLYYVKLGTLSYALINHYYSLPWNTMVCLYPLTAIFIAVVLRWLTSVLVTNLAFFPGFCYLHLYPGREIDALSRHGLLPMWKEIIEDNEHDCSIKVECTLVNTELKLMHIKPVLIGGKSIKDIDKKYHDYFCGDTNDSLGRFVYVQVLEVASRLLRMGAVCYSLAWESWHLGGFILLLIAFSQWKGIEKKYTLGVIGCIVTRFGRVEVTLVLMAATWLIPQFVNYLYIGWWCAGWWSKETVPYPAKLSDPVTFEEIADFMYFDTNYHIEKQLSTESTAMVDKASTAFRNETGVADAKVITTPKRGVLHESAMKHAIMKLEEKYLDGNYVIIIGDTFKDYSKNASGMAIQPYLIVGDSHKLAFNPSKRSLGQQVVAGRIDTSCDAVGSTTIWDPGWTGVHLDGAVITCHDPYTVPIKAILGVATKNGTDTVCITMCAFPDMFLQTHGDFPWSEKRYRRDKSDITIYCHDDSNDPIVAKTRILYEHLFTTSVETMPGIYYTSKIVDRTYDIHTIVWKRTKIKPLDDVNRVFSVESDSDFSYLACMRDALKMDFSMIKVHKQFGEYLQQAKELETLRTSFRSLTDSLNRNLSHSQRYFDDNTIDGLWEAEMWRRYFSERSQGYTNGVSWSELFGLETDKSLGRTVCKTHLDMLVRQPKETYMFKTLVQDVPYMALRMMSIVPQIRIYPYPPNEVPFSGIIPQSYMDRFNVSKIVEYSHSKSNVASVGEQMCYALFGRDNVIPAILPLGEPHRGGSLLTKQGNRLRASELEHLVSYGPLVLLVKDENGVNFYSGSSSDNDRKVVIKWDMTQQKVTRINYPDAFNITDIYDHYDAVNDDLTNRNTDIDAMAGTLRVYASDGSTPNKMIAEIRQQLVNKGGQDGMSPSDVTRTTTVPYPFSPVVAVPGMTWQDLNREVSSFECRTYDGSYFVDDMFIPGHYYWDWSIDDIRRIRKSA